MKSSDPDCDCLHSYSVSPRWFTFPDEPIIVEFHSIIDQNYVWKIEYNAREKYNEKFILRPLWRIKKFDGFGRRIETQNNFLNGNYFDLIWKTNFSFSEKEISMTGNNLVFYRLHKILYYNSMQRSFCTFKLEVKLDKLKPLIINHCIRTESQMRLRFFDIKSARRNLKFCH